MPQGDDIRTFRANNKTYAIPRQEVSDFLKDMPNAKEVVLYKANNKKYAIPISDTSAFQKDMPDAERIYKPTPKINVGGGFLNSRLNVLNMIPGREHSYKPVSEGTSPPQTLEQAVDEDESSFSNKIEDWINKIPYDQKSEQQKLATLERSGNVKKITPPEAKGLNKVIEDAGTIIEAIPEAFGHGAIKMIEGVPQQLINLSSSRGLPNTGLPAVGVPTASPRSVQQISKDISGLSEEVANTIAPKYGHNKEEIQKMSPVAKFVGNSLTGMAEFMPAMLTAPATGGASLYFSGYQSALDQVKDKNIDPSLKQGYAMLSGGIFAALNAIPIGRMLNKTIADKIVGKLAIKSLDKAIGEAKGKLSFDVLTKALNEAKVTLADRAKNLGAKGLKNLAEGAAFTVADQLSQLGLKYGVNKIAGEDVLEIPTSSEFLQHSVSGTAALGMMQIFMGGYGGRVNEYIKRKVAEAKRPEDLDGLHSQIDQMSESGKVNPKNAEELHQSINAYAEIKKTLPHTLTPEQEAQTFDLIKQRNQFKETLNDLQEQLKSVENPEEPSLKGVMDEAEKELRNEIKHTQDAISSMNDKIVEAATGKKYKYYEKDGSHYKKLGDQKEEKISEEQYDLDNDMLGAEAGVTVVTPEEEAPKPESQFNDLLKLPQDDIKDNQLYGIDFNGEVPEKLKPYVTGKTPTEDGTITHVGITGKEAKKIGIKSAADKLKEERNKKLGIEPEKEGEVVSRNYEIPNEQNTKGGNNAIQEQKPNEEVLRNEGISREGELPGVGEENKKETSNARETEEEVKTPASPESPNKKISFGKNEYSVSLDNGELKVRNKKGEEPSATTRRKVIKEYQKHYDFNTGERSDTKEPDFEFSNPDEAERWALENTKNPAEVAEIYLRQEPDVDINGSKEALIADFGVGKVKTSSFNEFNDRNNVAAGLAHTYLRKDGQPLDVIAKEMSDHYDVEITPGDVAEFMVEHPNGENVVRETQIMRDAKDKFRELTGMELNKGLADKISENENNRTIRGGLEKSQRKGMGESPSTSEKVGGAAEGGTAEAREETAGGTKAERLKDAQAEVDKIKNEPEVDEKQQEIFEPAGEYNPELRGNPGKDVSSEQIEKSYGSKKEFERAIKKTAGEAGKLSFKQFLDHLGRYNGSVLEAIKRRTVLRGFVERGYVDFTGTKITSPADLADLYLIHRSPHIEKAHVIYMKDGKIVGTDAVTAGLPFMTHLPHDEYVVKKAKELGADGIYLNHNHPSGDPTPSNADILATKWFTNALKGSGIENYGHVIIDTNKFTFIDKYGHEKLLDYKRKPKKLFTTRINLGDKGSDVKENLAQLADKMLKEPDVNNVVVYTTPKFDIIGYDVIGKEDIPQAVENMKKMGGTGLFFLTSDKGFAEEAYKNVYPALSGDILLLENNKVISFDYDLGKYPKKEFPEGYLDNARKLWEKAAEYGKEDNKKSMAEDVDNVIKEGNEKGKEKPKPLPSETFDKTIDVVEQSLDKSGNIINAAKDAAVYLQNHFKGEYDKNELAEQFMKYMDLRKEKYTPEEAKAAEDILTGKNFENIIGGSPVTPSNDIAPEPIVGEKPKRLSDITKDLVNGLNVKIRKVKKGTGSAGAAYNPMDAGIITRRSRNLKYVAHEVGHFLDDKFGLLKDISKSKDKGLTDELDEFSRMQYARQPPKNATATEAKEYRLGEGFAEWLRNYIAAPEATAKKAPNIYKLFNSMPKDVKDVIDQYSKDYRIFSGSTSFEQTMASVKMEPDKAEGALKQLLKTKKDNPDFSINWKDNLAANWVDPLHALNKAYKYLRGIKGLEEVLPHDDPYILARLFLSVDRKFSEALKQGLRDPKGKFYLNADGGKITLEGLLKNFDNTSSETIKHEMAQAVHYMISERVVELANRFNREDLISGVGGGVITDLDAAVKGIHEFRALPESTQKRLKKAIGAYRDMADATLKYMVDAGRLSPKQYKIIKDNNLFYVALNRIRDIAPDEEIVLFKNTGNSRKIGVVKKIRQKVRGSEAEIQNPYTSLLDNLYRSLKEADRNKIMLALRNLMVTGREMHDGEPIPISNIGNLGEGENSIPIFVNGKVEHWTFEPELYKSLKGINETAMQLPWLAEAIAKVPALLRSSIVYFPAFQLRNVTRDTFDSFVKSVTGKSFKHFFKGTKQDWDDVAAMGGLNAGYYAHSPESYYAHMEEAIKKIAKNKDGFIVNGDKMKRAFQKYEHFLEKGESLNRVAEYRSALEYAKNKLGYDDYDASLYAAFRSRDLMDFALMGYQMRLVNKFIPFSNAAVQGMRSAIRSAKEKPGMFAVKMVAYTVVPQVIAWVWNHRNEESAKRYEELPAWRRDLYWNIPLGSSGKYLTIPKPYELGMPAAAIDRGLSKVFGYRNDAFDGYVGEVIQSMSPISDIGVFAGPLAPIVEVAANKDFFRDKHIISPWEEKLPLDERHTEYASRIGQAIQKIAPIDARYTDFLLRNTLGYYGAEAIKLSNIGRENTTNKPSINDLGFFRDYPAYDSKSVQDFTDYAKEHGKTSSKEYKKFRAIVTMYFQSKTSKEREQLAKDMIDYAKEQLNRWNISDYTQKEHKKSVRRKKKQAEATNTETSGVGIRDDIYY